jgi:outer membrane receptor protein involved in Fe transport
MNLRVRGRSRVIDVLLIATLAVAGAIPAFATETHYFDVPAEDAPTAIRDFASQAHVQILVAGENVKEKHLHAVSGEFSTEQGLRLLLTDSGLSPQYIGDRSIALVTAAGSNATPQGNAKEGKKSSSEEFRVAQVDQVSSGPQVEQRSADSKSKSQLEEIVVTGSHIRGVTDSASPILSFSSADIEQSGQPTTEQFIQTLPQNFNGGLSATNLGGIGNGGGDNAGQNVGLGTGVNLRGLGNDSTLVLLNGRRIAPAGLGYSVDLSMIPIAAIDRIDILTDGASAIYGSDAVGGVVNIFLKKSYEGAETTLRYGSVTSGGSKNEQASQLFGHDWGTGSAIIDYTYDRQTPLNADSRSFTETIPQPTDVIQPETRQSVLASGSQTISNRISLFADGLFSERTTDLTGNFGGLEQLMARQNNYGGTLGLTVATGTTWQVEAAANYNRSNTQLYENFPTFDFSQTFRTAADVLSFDAKADGTLIHLPGGDSKMAVGGQARREAYNSYGSAEPTLGSAARNVYAGFAEMFIPIVGAPNAQTGLRRLETTLAVRYEHYGDFGSTTNPKVGLAWSPIEAISFRGTFGTSFRAPLLFELDAHSFSSVEATGLLDPSNPTGTTQALILRGNNPDLTPEKSRSWTAGFDITPASLPGFKASLTYFNTYFKQLISPPIPGNAVTSVLLEEALYAATITRNPNIQTVNALFANPNFFNQSGATPAQIGALVDDRLTNIANKNISGVDLYVTARQTTDVGLWTETLNSTYFLGISNQLTPTSPQAELANTVYNPVRLRARGSVDWSYHGVDVAGFVNFQGLYRDNRALAPEGGPDISPNVASWTTVDTTIAYDTGADNGNRWKNGIRVALSVQNLLDRNPPFVAGIYGLNFDSANATAMGRFISLTVRKKW